ncbi:MAG: hypothetical protein DME00_21175 [Candidatus Rokuibacteriota bacterium]|nr:MAG: hypothetical protein DME00_21175 [Candidatus Rokubacteria bacterium]PYO08045.1 MAG: hypothetical protein DMD75_19410 [Candidatus Rokubacteria bacterium]
MVKVPSVPLRPRNPRLIACPQAGHLSAWSLTRWGHSGHLINLNRIGGTAKLTSPAPRTAGTPRRRRGRPRGFRRPPRQEARHPPLIARLSSLR